MSSKSDTYIFAANELEKLGTAGAYKEAQSLKAAAMREPIERSPETEREIEGLKALIADLESKGQFNAAAPYKTKLSHLTSPI